MGYFPIVPQVLYLAIFPYDCDVLSLLLKFYYYIAIYSSFLALFCIFLTSPGSPISMVLVSLPGISRGKRGYFDKMIGWKIRITDDNDRVSF